MESPDILSSQAARLPSCAPSIRIGTAGWSIPRQHVALFPVEGSHIERYSKVLACTEINSSFYRPHRPSTYVRWAAMTPENFQFSVKAPKAITHECDLSPTRTQLQDFLNEARCLGGKLGPILFQLPPRQDFDKDRARDFLALFRDLCHEGEAVLEPRHPAWFSSEADEILREFRIARVIADPPPTAEATQAGGHEASDITGCTARLASTTPVTLPRISRSLLPVFPPLHTLIECGVSSTTLLRVQRSRTH